MPWSGSELPEPTAVGGAPLHRTTMLPPWWSLKDVILKDDPITKKLSRLKQHAFLTVRDQGARGAGSW